MGNKKKKKKEKKGGGYFEIFEELVSYSCRAAEYLDKTLREFEPEKLQEAMEEIHAIEHAADDRKHQLMEQLAKEFRPPIQREDIVSLTQEIDNVTDAVEDVLLKLYMYNIASIREDALTFSEALVHCAKALKNTMKEFGNYKKSDCIHETIVEINRLEEEGDKLYTEAVHKLFSEVRDPIEIFAWAQTYAMMENCCDACEHTANLVESIIMNN